jgi:hypothetical protein
MVKRNTVQKSVYLDPTGLGKSILDKWDAAGLDAQATARRWIGLGFLADRLGFAIDGELLTHHDPRWAALLSGKGQFAALVPLPTVEETGLTQRLGHTTPALTSSAPAQVGMAGSDHGRPYEDEAPSLLGNLQRLSRTG